jgi:hypothetical protein
MPKQAYSAENIGSFGAVILVLIAIACSGCGSKSRVVRVRGKVLLDDKPLASGSVATLPQSGRGSKGAIINGEF